MFETRFTHLTDFNRATLQWVKQQLKLKFEMQETGVYVKKHPEEIIDLRNVKNTPAVTLKYYQVFEERTGFLPDLSILDLLFSEGPLSVDKLIG